MDKDDFFSGAVDGTWTHTVSHTPLKRTRLPVPPQPHYSILSVLDCMGYYTAATAFCQALFSPIINILFVSEFPK